MQRLTAQFVPRTCVFLFVFLMAFSTNADAEQKYEADVVVVGAGGAGLSAALVAGQGGASVVILEKDVRVGGTTVFAEGLFGVETEMQRLNWIDLEKDEVFNEEMAEMRWSANAALVRRFHNESAKSIDWLQAQGVKFIGPSRNNYTNNPTWHLIDGRGAALIRALQIQIKKNKNIKLLLQTPGKGLIVEKGRVVGVKAENRRGEDVTVKARGGVILATGGFGNNPEMLKKYSGAENVIPATPLKKTGDGINMAMGLGADVEGMDVVQYVASMDALPGKGPDLNIGAIAVSPRNVWVNKFGKRFTNEYIAFDFPFAANAIIRQKTAWAIFDENLKKYYMEKGVDAGLGVLVPVGKKYPNFDELWNKAIKGGNPFVVKANSLKELARKTNLPLNALEKTFIDYNEGASVNDDPAFAKDRKWLQIIDMKGPLYAVKLREILLTTEGGVKVDEFLRPLDKDDNIVVEGLYMTGTDVGGLYVGTYTLTFASGSNFGFAVTSGRLAAKAILDGLKL